MKPVLRILGILAVIAAAVAVAVPLLFDADSFRPLLESRMTSALGRDVKLARLKLSIFSARVVADDLSVSEDPAFGAIPFLKAKALHLRVDLPALLFSRQLSVKAVELDQPTVSLIQDAAGKWNISSLGAKRTAALVTNISSSSKNELNLSMQRIAIENGTLSIGPKPYLLTKVQLEVLNFTETAAFPFSLSMDTFGGVFQVNGKAGPILSTDVAATPLDATFTAKSINLAAIPTSLGGLVSLQGSVNWDGHSARLKAHGSGEKLKLVPGGSPAAHPVELDCALVHDLASQTGNLTQGDVHIGKATVQITGSYNALNPQISVNMLASGQNMPMSDLAAMMPAVDVVLPFGASIHGGRASIRLTVDGPVDQLVTKGQIGASGFTIVGFDLGSRMSTLEKLAGIRTGPNTEIQQFGTSVLSNARGVSLDNIKLFATGVGQISGAGIISPTHQLNFNMRANLHSPGAIAATFGLSATSGVPFTIMGTTSNPAFKPNLRGIALDDLHAPETAGQLLKGLLGGKKRK